MIRLKYYSFLFCLCLIISCSSDEDCNNFNTLNEADVFVNSDSFTQLDNLLSKDRKQIALAYKSLSKADKMRCLKLQELGKGKSGKERTSIYL